MELITANYWTVKSSFKTYKLNKHVMCNTFIIILSTYMFCGRMAGRNHPFHVIQYFLVVHVISSTSDPPDPLGEILGDRTPRPPESPPLTLNHDNEQNLIERKQWNHASKIKVVQQMTSPRAILRRLADKAESSKLLGRRRVRVISI